MPFSPTFTNNSFYSEIKVGIILHVYKISLHIDFLMQFPCYVTMFTPIYLFFNERFIF